jgi:hypothetical protein
LARARFLTDPSSTAPSRRFSRRPIPAPTPSLVRPTQHLEPKCRRLWE